MIVPIRAILEAAHGPLFGPAEIAALTAAFDAALRKLELVDRHDPAAIAVAKLIVIAARKGERDPSRLCNQVVTVWQNRWPPQLVPSDEVRDAIAKKFRAKKLRAPHADAPGARARLVPNEPLPCATRQES